MSNKRYTKQLQKANLSERKRVVRFLVEYYDLLANVVMVGSFFLTAFFAVKESGLYQIKQVLQKFRLRRVFQTEELLVAKAPQNQRPVLRSLINCKPKPKKINSLRSNKIFFVVCFGNIDCSLRKGRI